MQEKMGVYIFGALQAATLGLIIFFTLGQGDIGKDTIIMLSILFPLFTLIIEYLIYDKRSILIRNLILLYAHNRNP